MNDQVKFYESKLAYEIDSYDVHAAQKAGTDIVVIDARQEAAYTKAHIAGAISFPHARMTAENMADFDKKLLYAVYCDGIGCNASTAGAMKMAKLGFNVRELIGGLEWWKNWGYPVEAGAPQQSDVEAICGCG